MAAIDWDMDYLQTNGFLGVPEYFLTGSAVQIDFEDSLNCGGINPDPQFFTIRGSVRARTITVAYRGRVERQNTEYERIELRLECDNQPEFQNETLIFQTGSYGDGAGCPMSHTPRLDYIYPNTDFVEIVSSPSVPHDSDIPGIGVIKIKKLQGLSYLRVNMYTGDGLYHTNAYLRLDFSFAGANVWNIGKINV